MRRTLTTISLVSALFLVPALAQPAQAQVFGGFSLGGWFRVGPVSFSLVFGAPFGGRPGYYYRTSDRFGVRGVHCTDRCFRQGGYVYHDPSCPVVARYFALHHQRPYLLFEGYAPPPVWRGQFYGDRYDRYDRYGSYDRYDRYRSRRDSGRYWSRNDRKRYYERYGFSRRELYRGRGGRDFDRDRGRDRDGWRERHGRDRGDEWRHRQ